MKQNEENSLKKAQELTNEELEQVNGGKVTIQDIMKSTTAILMFP
jgi:lactobin A/cerein 7B family class IIb bacteriocin